MSETLTCPRTVCGMSQPKRLRNAVDVLTTVPEMVGYFPHNSLVIIPLADGHGRACIRIDLPAGELSIGPEDYALMVLHQVKQLPDANEVLLVVFSDRLILRGKVPFDKHQRAITHALEFVGIRVRGALCWANNGWSNFDATEKGPLHELERPEGSGVAANFEEFAAISETDVDARLELARAIGFVDDLTHELGLSTVLLAWENLLDAEPWLVDDEKTAAQAILAVALRRLLMAECILANAAYGPEVAHELRLVWMTLDVEDEQHVDSLISDRLETEPVNLRRVTDGIAVLRDLIAALPPRESVHSYAALSWLEWARGSCSLASHYAHEALAFDPSHPLATTVAIASDNGFTPGWISEVGVSGGFTEDDFDELLKVTE